MKTKLFAMLMALVMMLSCTAALAETVYPVLDEPLYYDIHDYTQWPVIPEGETATIKVMTMRNESYGIDAEDMWFWNWLSEYTGFTFEIEQVSQSALSERVSMMFGSDDLPDIIWGCKLSSNDLVTYGQEEGMLLDMSSYINEDVMPNYCSVIEMVPEALSDVQFSDGSVYTLPVVRQINYSNLGAAWINTEMMNAAGYESAPETLDEFIDMLYKMKANDPDCIPLGGGQSVINPIGYILNAYGYIVAQTTDGVGRAMRNGEVVIPAADPLFKEALTLLNQLYKDGIIDPDFYTVDATTAKANAGAGKYGVINNLPSWYTSAYEEYSKWTCANPLTSEHNATKQWPMVQSVTIGNFAVNSESKYAEEIMRMADAFFEHKLYIMQQWGPMEGSEYTMGITGGWSVGDDYNLVYKDKDGNTMSANVNNYTVGYGMASNSIGQGAFPNEFPDLRSVKNYKFYLYGKDTNNAPYNDGDVNGYCNMRTQTTVFPYRTAGFPYNYYLEADVALELSELNAVLTPYMQAESAKFITGQRSLDEFDKYLSELNSMGMGDLLAIYQSVIAK